MERQQIWDAISGTLENVIHTRAGLRMLLTLSPEKFIQCNYQQLVDRVFSDDRWLVGFVEDLQMLFALNLTQFTHNSRQRLLDTILEKLKELPWEGKQLQALFSLSLEQLTLTQRQQIWHAIGNEQLGRLIPDQAQRDQLNPFLRRSTPSPRFFGGPVKQEADEVEKTPGLSPTP